MEYNSIGYWVMYLITGGVIGWVAGIIVRGRGFGIIPDIVIGIVGSMLGGWMGRVIGISAGSSVVAFIMAVIGAVVLVSLTRFFNRLSV